MHKIIYHQVKPGVDCPDGIAAAWVTKQKYPDAEVVGCCYDGELPSVESGDKLTIVDFSFPKDRIEQWLEMGIEIEIIDHHLTALDHLKGLSDRILFEYNEYECGATLAWRHWFRDRPMPVFLAYIRDRDLWDFRLEHTPEIHEALSTLRYQSRQMDRSVFALFDAIANLREKDLLAILLPIGHPLTATKRQRVAEIAARAEPDRIARHKVLCVKLNLDGSEDRYVSDVCMKLYRDNPKIPFVACVTSDGSISLRSDKHGNNFDVRAIAQKFGGGGHHNAAGFRPK